MAWPDRGKPGLPYQSETFPDDWKTKTSPQLIHGDMHQENSKPNCFGFFTF